MLIEPSNQLVPDHVHDVEGHFIIVASKFNPELVDGLINHAQKVLSAHPERKVDIYRVPGAFEIPAASARCLSQINSACALICFGAVIQGETSHAEQVTMGVTNALAHLQIQYLKPVIHGVGHFNNMDQARVRCLDSRHNRGSECAIAALEMVQLFTNDLTL